MIVRKAYTLTPPIKKYLTRLLRLGRIRQPEIVIKKIQGQLWEYYYACVKLPFGKLHVRKSALKESIGGFRSFLDIGAEDRNKLQRRQHASYDNPNVLWALDSLTVHLREKEKNLLQRQQRKIRQEEEMKLPKEEETKLPNDVRNAIVLALLQIRFPNEFRGNPEETLKRILYKRR